MWLKEEWSECRGLENTGKEDSLDMRLSEARGVGELPSGSAPGGWGRHSYNVRVASRADSTHRCARVHAASLAVNAA